MAEGVLPDDRLVRLHRHPGDALDEPARLVELLCAHVGVELGEVAARLDRHDHLFERGVAGALADPVDRALHLARAVEHASQRVRRRHPEVVVAVHGDARAIDVRHVLVQRGDQRAELLRDRVADGVGDVDRRRTLVDRCLEQLVDELRVGAGGVHRRELDVGAVPLGPGDGGARHLHHVLAVLAQLVRHVDLARGDEDVDPRRLRLRDRVPARLDVVRVRACEAGDHRALHLACDQRDRLEVARRGEREARLDDVHVEPRELLRDLELVLDREADACRLLAVAEGGVEDIDLVAHRRSPVLVFDCSSMPPGPPARACAAEGRRSTRVPGGPRARRRRTRRRRLTAPASIVRPPQRATVKVATPLAPAAAGGALIARAASARPSSPASPCRPPRSDVRRSGAAARGSAAGRPGSR